MTAELVIFLLSLAISGVLAAMLLRSVVNTALKTRVTCRLFLDNDATADTDLMEGEGFFDVRHNEQIPLTVETHGVVVHDLGTAFKVSNYRSDANIDIRLYEGKLSIHNTLTKGCGINMSPGEEVLISKATGKYRRQHMEESLGEGASMNILYFDNQSLRTVARALSRSYGVHIEVAKTAEYKQVYLIINRKANSIVSSLHGQGQPFVHGNRHELRFKCVRDCRNPAG